MLRVCRPASIRSFRLFSGTSASSEKKRVLFLGSPTFAAESLQTIHAASLAQDSLFDVVGVVTVPVSGQKKIINPVETTARKLGLPVHRPETAKDPEFLTQLEGMNLDLCITAAYGNYLPKRFLAIPMRGTVNIHPSLLPKYRGAAPVQRCLENGDAMTGVSIAFTQLKMDSGPVISQVLYPLTGNEKTPQVLTDCFRLGTQALLSALPAILDGTIVATPQEDSQKSEAPKLTAPESILSIATMSATQIHNKCRAFADWPGTNITLQVGDADSPAVPMKLITTTVLAAAPGSAPCTQDVVMVKHHYLDKEVYVLRVVCGDGSVLGIVELQQPMRKVMGARDFVNGLRGERRMRWLV